MQPRRTASSTTSAADFLPSRRTLRAARLAAATCKGCHLWQSATQTVFGAGSSGAYVTNAVKHFKWEPRGKRRIHRSPDSREVGACLPWLELEIDLVRPEILVCLGAIAGKALLGADFRVTRDRGRLTASRLGPKAVATVHPSALLRLPEAADREAEIARFVADLEVARRALH
jgi:DNA polymerase